MLAAGRFLLLREGDACNELRRAESERILRAQPFIADASIDVVPSVLGGAGAVDLIVRTSDEVAVVLGGAASFVRAPTLRKGRTLLVGFDEATYRAVLR